ncbi:MAG: Z1 domain-containing protein [Malacoplasma sp.]|nr:Z1 domain-containing protein [Malacoplasma sp.]
MKINEWKLYQKENDCFENNEKHYLNETSDFHRKNLENIFNSNSYKEHVLCVGQVQSGKTKNIENVIDYAIKNKYKLIIVFSGITKILLNQTNARINNFDYAKNIKFIEFVKNTNLIVSLENNDTVILSILKSSDSINTVFEEIDLINWENYKVLIIDDECDYASINISPDETSRIYDLISNLYNRFYYVKLLSFTGTPFANIMSSNSKDLHVDRVVTLLNYDNYCGIKFFNENANYNYVPLDLNKEKLEYRHFYSIFWYWLTQTACALIENSEFKSELIVNIEVENSNQQEIFSYLRDAFFEICKDIRNEKSSKIKINSIIKKLKLEQDNIDLIKEKIYFVLREMNKNLKSFILLNSESTNKNFKSGFVQFCVIVGGFMISRGFTFENLTTEFFLNVPKSDSTKISVDTLLQRCRWFGNRKKDNRNKFLRIVMNKRICEALKSAQDYVEVFVPGTSTSNIGAIYKKIKELDEFNEIVESTNATKRK